VTPEEALEHARAILVPLEEAQAAGTLEREAWIAAWHELEALSDVAPGVLEAMFPLATDEEWFRAVGAGWESIPDEVDDEPEAGANRLLYALSLRSEVSDVEANEIRLELEAKLARSSSRAMLLRELERVLASVRRSK
jgi:hypothetical protein